MPKKTHHYKHRKLEAPQLNFIFTLVFIVGVVLLSIYCISSINLRAVRKTTTVIIPHDDEVGTENWVVIELDQFSLKFPGTWNNQRVEKELEESGILVKTNDFVKTDGKDIERGAYIYGPLDQKMMASAKSFDDVLKCDGCTVIKTQDITLDGQKAKEQIAKHGSEMYVTIAFKFPKPEGTTYSYITFVSAEKDYPLYREEFEKMLATFRFR